MQVARTIAEARMARARLGQMAYVPTMGALHEGHMSLVRAAQASAAASAVSIFVNPAQFGPHEDFDRYPRPLEADLAKLEAAGADLVFVPAVDTLYPPGFATRIEPGPIATRLEGAVRPGHFAGVVTVVAKLFAILSPDVAWFGQKDVQQTIVVRQLVRDLDLPVDIAVGPIVREADGLALSSRNIYLDAAQRAEAPALYRGLSAAEAAHARGERSADALRALVLAEIGGTSGVADYVSVAEPVALEEVEAIGPEGAVLSLAVRFGAVRLLDNVVLSRA